MKADLDAKAADPAHESVDWDLKSLRWAWNRAKDDVAPWWAENSKECYSSGLADLAQGLANWKAGKNGTRKGRRVGFPRFKSGRRDPGRVRFTTGTMRIEDDRRTITVLVIGPLRAKENTRRVQRHLVSGRAQILNMTLSQRWGRLFVAVCYALRTPTTRSPLTQPTVRAGMDLGVGPWPRSPPSTPPPASRPSSNTQTRPRSRRHSSPVAGPAENFPAASPAPMGIGQ